MALWLALGPMTGLSYGHPPLPDDVRRAEPSLHLLGKGSQRLWGFRVYDASLWVVSGAWNPEEPHVLDVSVQRAIPAGQLIDAGINEMERLGVGDATKRKQWKSELTGVVPDLRKDQRLIVFCNPNHTTYFYLDSGRIGEINDPSFGPAFFSIWLDPRTAKPQLRKSLLNK
ncbi:MAG TPA: chalcone isomerase family protein [Candidatus Binataceae bacterium]|nr:chalcone isomerase family protein [Candidatus Binataceae bacterium]